MWLSPRRSAPLRGPRPDLQATTSFAHRAIGALMVGALALGACAAERPSAEGPRRLKETESPERAELRLRSDRLASVLTEALGSSSPEALGQLGLPGLDHEITDLEPGVEARFRQRIGEAKKTLESRRAAARAQHLAQDLEIVIRAAEMALREQDLEVRYLVPYIDVTQVMYTGIRALLDERVEPARRASARIRLERYAGLGGGRSLPALAEDRTRERLLRPDVLLPPKAEVEHALAESAARLRGIRLLFERFPVAGEVRPALARLESEVERYEAFVRGEILPKARTDFRLPPELYAFALEKHGVELAPAALAEAARRAFEATQREMEPLARRVAEAKFLPSKDYRDVLRALKKDVIPPAEMLGHYRQRVREVEALIVRERLLRLPEREVAIRVASEAEMAEDPGPHVDPQGLFSGAGPITLVLPAPHALRGRRSEDFSFAAASWSLAAHEARPGHELQFSTARRSLSLARLLFAFNKANVEGWAMYAEGLVRPFFPDEGRLVSLQFRLAREVRAFLDPELHLGLISMAEARRILEQDVVLSPASADAELRRYTIADPGQATADFYGGARLRAIREEAERALGSRFDPLRFHDFILAQGLLPPALLAEAVRASLDALAAP